MTLELFAGLATLVFIVVSAVVGARLLLLSRRTRGLPEFIFGLGLFIIVAVGYPLSLVGRLAAADVPEIARWVTVASALPMGIGWSCVWIFTWKVFRPGSVAVAWLVRIALAAAAGLVVVQVAHVISIPDPAAIVYGDLRFMGVPFLGAASYCWAAAESFAYGRMMRRRVALGLADPVVANRFTLFGWTMVTSTIATAVPAIGEMRGVAIVESPLVLVVSAVAGLMCGACLLLAFLPPERYLARVRAS